MLVTSTTENKILTSKLNKVIDMKIRKAFSLFYHRHSKLIIKYNIGFKTLLQQGILGTVFYGDLVYKLKRIIGKPKFCDQIKKNEMLFKNGYKIDIMRQSVWLVVSLITVYSYGFLFNCTTGIRPQTQ